VEMSQLRLHEISVVLPNLEKALLVRLIGGTHSPHDGAGLELDLSVRIGGKDGREGAALLRVPLSTWVHEVGLVHAMSHSGQVVSLVIYG